VRLPELNAGKQAMVAYTSVSLMAAVAFLLLSLVSGADTWVARLGGAAWVFFLSMIILMPTLGPWMRKRLGG